MSKRIAVTDEVYEDLKGLMGAQETFSHVIERLLAIVKPIKQASEILGPSHYLKQRPNQED